MFVKCHGDGVDDTDTCCLHRCTSIEEPVVLHRGSVLRKGAPQYVAYQEIYETNKLYMRGQLRRVPGELVQGTRWFCWEVVRYIYCTCYWQYIMC